MSWWARTPSTTPTSDSARQGQPGAGQAGEWSHGGSAEGEALEVGDAEVAGGAQGLDQYMMQRQGVVSTILDGELLTVMHQLPRDDEPELLKELIEAGFRIAEFTRKVVTLEDVFLEVTKGQIQ